MPRNRRRQCGFPPLMSINEFEAMLDEVNAIFGDKHQPPFNKTTIPYDVLRTTDENNETTSFTIHIPAIKHTKKDITVSLDTETESLNVVMEKSDDDTVDYVYHTISSAKKMLTFKLTDIVNADKIESKVENGMLIIDIPLLAEELRPNPIKKITVK